jgi:hypothetical protein
MTNQVEKIVLGGKLCLVITLLIMSFVNGHKDYIEQHPRKFILDSVLTGFMSGIASVFLCYTRGRPDLVFNSFLLTFLFFFFYSVCREMSGYFAFMGNGKLTQGEDKQKNILKVPMTILIGIVILVAISLVVINREQPEYSTGILSNYRTPFFIELVVFSIIASSGDVTVAINHGENPRKAFIEGASLFGLTHIILQYGGFYNQIFR